MIQAALTTIPVCGETLALDVSGAVWWPAQETLIAADLHFEKGSAYARGGQFLPPYDTRATRKRLETLVQRFGARRVIALGDSFHDGDASGRLDAAEVAALALLTERVEWIWVTGNHDPSPPDWIGGRVAHTFSLGALTFRHEPRGEAGEVAGHLHPAVRISRGGVSVRRRCFVCDGATLILPAFGAYAGGLDVRDKAVAGLFRDGYAAYALGRERVYLVADQLRRKKNVDAQPSVIAIKTAKTP